MKYYQVAPLRKVTSESGVLTYSSEETLEKGRLVVVTILNKSVNAVVLAEVTKPEFSTKEIVKILSDEVIIPEHLISLARFISDRYLCSLGEAVASVLSTNPFKTRRKSRTETKEEPLVKNDAPDLSKKQQEIVSSIIKSEVNFPHLIHGVTGSGKTEIYLKLTEDALKNGQNVIVLVPEISLTPQTYQRFAERFYGKVALIHSEMTEVERHRVWTDAYFGKINVVLGPRSALFMPLKNLGYIIIDEAHDGSYKQDQTPRYNAISVATELAQKTGAKLVLGTATPLVEQYYLAKNGQYILHQITERVGELRLPDIEVVDLRNEYKLGNRSIISEQLKKKVAEALKNNEQVLLFINRRGMSTFVSCRECGYVSSCPNCDIPLVFHYDKLRLECHRCGMSRSPEVKCPDCGSLAIRYFGGGTQKLENELKKLFPTARLLRVDKDSTNRKDAHKTNYMDIANREVDIIVGTQMVTKGLDFGGISVVGVITVDNTLNQPDYFSEERVFDHLTQVVGRTGRSDKKCIAIIQTYQPEVKIFTDVKNASYESFYTEELNKRAEHQYPPFAKLVKILYNHSSQESAKQLAQSLSDNLAEALSKDKELIAVSTAYPAYVEKKNGNYYYQIDIKLSTFEQNSLSKIRELTIKDKNATVDVEPYGLL